MLTTDSRLYRAIMDRDGDALRHCLPQGVTRQLTVRSEVYTIRRELRDGREWVWDLPRRVVIGAAFDRGAARPAAWLADQPGVIVWLDEPSGRPDAHTAEALVEDLRAAGGDV